MRGAAGWMFGTTEQYHPQRRLHMMAALGGSTGFAAEGAYWRTWVTESGTVVAERAGFGNVKPATENMAEKALARPLDARVYFDAGG